MAENYYNTVGLEGDELREQVRIADAGDFRVQEMFLRFDNGQGLTPRQVHQHGGGYEKWELTSVRRSMNTLTKKGWLVKTGEKRWSDKSSKEHVWKRMRSDGQMRLI